MADTLFRIEMLPARQGDALWIEYGVKPRVRRILIDGGPNEAYQNLKNKLDSLPAGDQVVELVVVSHVDTDHIDGIIHFLAEAKSAWPIVPGDIWFNGWRHMQENALLGGVQGDFLSALIERRVSNIWNKAFGKKTIVVKPDKPLPVVDLQDGMRLTILSPTPEKLKEMAGQWEKDVAKSNLKPGDLDAAWKELENRDRYHPGQGLLGGAGDTAADTLRKQLGVDDSKANGSSIAFLAEFGGKSCLFLADAHADVLCESLDRLIPTGQTKLKVDAVKVSHHGSKHNISIDLMKRIDAEHFLISTNGSLHDHPDREAVNMVIDSSDRTPTLWFNYKTDHTTPWENGPTGGSKPFTAHYPASPAGGITVEL